MSGQAFILFVGGETGVDNMQLRKDEWNLRQAVGDPGCIFVTQIHYLAEFL